jgi:hypothetical protein
MNLAGKTFREKIWQYEVLILILRLCHQPAKFVVQLQQPTKINCIVLREAIHLGQTVRKFNIVLYNGDKIISQIQGTSVGRKRILSFPATTVYIFQGLSAGCYGQ